MWYVYILECKNGQFYTGITNDVNRRFKEHKQGKGGRFTRVFGANRIVHKEELKTRQDALQRETQIKGWSRKKKQTFIKGKLQ